MAKSKSKQEKKPETSEVLGWAEQAAEKFGLEIDPSGEVYGGPGLMYTVRDPDAGSASLTLREDMSEQDVLDAIVQASQNLATSTEPELDDQPEIEPAEPQPAEQQHGEPSSLGERPRRAGEITYYFLIDDRDETNAALTFLNDEGVPMNDQTHRKVQALRTDRLDERHVVIPVLRNVNQDYSFNRPDTATGRMRNQTHHASVHAARPIDCSEFIRDESSADGFGDVNFDEEAFIRELGRACVPATLKRDTDKHIVRMRYA